MDALIAFFLLGLAAVIIVFFYSLSLKRQKMLAAYAESRGLSFSLEKDKNMSRKYPSFNCLRRGHSRYAHNIMRGEPEGRSVTAFDYHYVTGSGKSRQTHRFSALVVESPLPLKPLMIRPENIFDKVSDFFGFDDIDFESAEFSRKFYVKAPEKRWAYDVIHPQMMAYLLEAPRFSIQFDPASIMTWRNNRFDEQDFDDAFILVQRILDYLPRYVKDMQREDAEKNDADEGEK